MYLLAELIDHYCDIFLKQIIQDYITSTFKKTHPRFRYESHDQYYYISSIHTFKAYGKSINNDCLLCGLYFMNCGTNVPKMKFKAGNRKLLRRSNGNMCMYIVYMYYLYENLVYVDFQIKQERDSYVVLLSYTQ